MEFDSVKNLREYLKEKPNDMDKHRVIVRHENGKISSEANYVGKRLHGRCTYWSKTGIKVGQVNFKNGIKHGKSFSCWANGHKLEEGYYKNGKIHGVLNYSSPDGLLQRKYMYKDGLCVGNVSDREFVEKANHV